MENQFYKSLVKTTLFCFTLLSFLGLPQVKGQDVSANEHLQVIWGLAGSDENEHGPDNIFSLNSDGTGYTVHHTYLTETQLMGKLVQGNDEYMYGVTLGGGDFGGGTVYRIGIDGSGYTVLHNFDSHEGRWPSFIMYGGDGFLYGTTSGHGEHGRGSVFKIQTNGENFQVIRYNERDFFYGVRLLGRDGNLYGMSEEHLFSLSTDGNYFHIHASLSLPQFAYGQLITQSSEGYFYGTITLPGDIHTATSQLFKIRPDGENFEILKEDIYISDFLEYSDGVFYGIQYGLQPLFSGYAEGALFTINADGSGFSQLMRFEPHMAMSLLKGNDGFLYGNTLQSIYRIRPDGTDFTTIRDFTPAEGFVSRITLVREVCPPPLLTPIEITPAENLVTGTEITVNASFSGNVRTAYWNWGDGNISSAEISDATISGTYIYQSPGDFTITLTITDDCGLQKFFKEVTISETTSNGSVKGTGMFSSPRGAYTDKPQMKGMAHYSISAKSENGEVSGNFQFHIADLQFKSTRFNRLQVDDNKAWLYGEGKIKGKGSYGFLIAAVDNQGSSEKDLLRVKIWDYDKDSRLVYDNQAGDPDESTATQEIDRGAIIILGEEENRSDQDLILDQLKKIKAYPNPVHDRVTVDLGSLSPGAIHTVVTDAMGQLELHDIHKVNGNQLEFNLSSLKSGFYYIQIRTEHGYRSIKLLKK